VQVAGKAPVKTQIACVSYITSNVQIYENNIFARNRKSIDEVFCPTAYDRERSSSSRMRCSAAVRLELIN
jgi:hypothetical protein